MNNKVLDNINRKVIDRITIDIDHYKAVPKALLNAISIFGKDRVKLYVTASGTGFRLEIIGKFTPLENIYYRAILEDDPYRLRFALARYLATGNPDILDISFYKKISKGRYKGEIIEIPIDEIISDEDIKEYEKNPTNMELHKKILDKITKYVKELYLWVIVIPNKEEYIKILANNEKKFKLLVDPYDESRIIFYQVSSENLLDKFKKYNIPIITYRKKVIKSKSIEEFR